MKKLAAAFVSIGVILVIVGLVLVGIYGRDQIKDGGIFAFGSSNLDSANGVEDKQPAELEGLTKITVSVAAYDVYLRPSSTDVLSVKYIDPLEVDTNLVVEYQDGELKITQTGRKNLYWGLGWFTNRRFVAVYVPQTEQFTQSQIRVNADFTSVDVENIACYSLNIFTQAGSVDIDDLKATAVVADTKAGSINVDNLTADDVGLSSSAGSINADEIVCDALLISTSAGSINANEISAKTSVNINTGAGSVKCDVTTEKLTIKSGAGSIKFETNASNITATSGAGSIKGTVHGDERLYEIKVRNDVGSTNIHSQHVDGATKFLTVESDVGSIRINFDND